MRRERSPFNRSKPDLKIVRNEASDEADVLLYDEIGFWGISATDFVRQLQQIDASTINLRINSPGGSVFDGVAIYNALKAHKARVVTHIEGLAASIASIIALAGDEVIIADNAFLMIHDPWTIEMGTAEQLRKTAGVLDKIGNTLVSTYVAKTGASEKEVQAWMKDETWFNGQEAVDAGFADSLAGSGDTEAAAHFDLSVFSKVPRELAASADITPSKKDLERCLRDAGLSRSAAKALVAEGYSAIESQRDAADEGVFTATERLVATLRAS